MAQVNKFCISCGSPLNPGARFCGGCGQAVTAAASTPPPASPPPPPYTPPPPQPQPYQQAGYAMPPYQTPPYQQPQQAYPPPPAYSYAPQPQYTPPPGENLIGVMPGLSRKKGFFNTEAINGIVTNARIIFAVQTPEIVKQEAAQAGEGRGFLGKMAGAMTAGFNIWKRYLNMPPEQALRENPQNFAIYLNQIRKVKYDAGRTIFKKGAISVGVGINRDDDEPAHLEIETMAEKLKFDVATHFQEEVRTALKQAGLIR